MPMPVPVPMTSPQSTHRAHINQPDAAPNVDAERDTMPSDGHVPTSVIPMNTPIDFPPDRLSISMPTTQNNEQQPGTRQKTAKGRGKATIEINPARRSNRLAGTQIEPALADGSGRRTADALAVAEANKLLSGPKVRRSSRR